MRIGVYYSSGVSESEEGWKTRNRGLACYLRELDRRGCKALLWAPKLDRGTTGYLLPPSVQVVMLPSFERWRQGYLHWWKLRSAFLRTISQVDWVWVRYPGPMGWWLAREARRCGLPVLWDVVGDPVTLVRVSGHYPPLVRQLAAALARGEERLVRSTMHGAACRFVNEQLRARYKPHSAHILVRPSGVLTKEDFYSRSDTCQEPPFRLLTVGFLRPEKGLSVLLEAVAGWEGPPIVLDIVGDGRQRNTLEREAQRLGITDKICFHGFVGDESVLRQFYRQADVFVISSLSEGSPRTLVEAMAASLPVIATAVGHIPNLIDDGVNGLLIESGSSSAIIDALMKVVSNPQLRQRILREGYNTARDHTVAAFIQDVLALVGNNIRQPEVEGKP